MRQRWRQGRHCWQCVITAAFLMASVGVSFSCRLNSWASSVISTVLAMLIPTMKMIPGETAHRPLLAQRLSGPHHRSHIRMAVFFVFSPSANAPSTIRHRSHFACNQRPTHASSSPCRGGTSASV
jgi:hypothetical protein